MTDRDETAPSGSHEDDAALLARFEAQAISREEWTHRRHFQIAYLYLTQRPYDEALEKIRRGIQALNRANGVDDTPDAGYHETITVAYTQLIRQRLAVDSFVSSEDFCQRNPDLLKKGALLHHYSAELLKSREARREFVAADVHPLDSSVSATGETTRVKQVIVMRHDLGMRRGKQIAQGAHAAMAFLCYRLFEGPVSIRDFGPAQQSWLSGHFAKVCCRVNSEQELLDIYAAAKAAGLEVHLITDSGRTEFHGQPTHTCLAIGPDSAEKIDPITGHLQLL
ncbi:aminoacyl-tRNA hydrolase [Blastopirellula sp. JC732]|uniref:peptidyl-tRNA hydrolase n=1 Tax=Blastopirellula sediminis TaxID=2894196 RepID=A0A9X1MR98_9BACT|nr:aminoacyl-tRNA hydrolase [Blastopirellula sediminis]MCC9605755.1 aminoacyl-tRNA hydrolase [Blastopirellula sediminis]MCC9630945.1 aminoacyl-tRNA hydrolase [Blastopirellula sediminis]